jgi:hypothetical protein
MPVHTLAPNNQNITARHMRSVVVVFSTPTIMRIVLRTSTPVADENTPAMIRPSMSVHHLTTTRKDTVKAKMPNAPNW